MYLYCCARFKNKTFHHFRQERLDAGTGGSCAIYWGLAHTTQREHKLQITAILKGMPLSLMLSTLSILLFAVLQTWFWARWIFHPRCYALRFTLCSQYQVCTQSSIFLSMWGSCFPAPHSKTTEWNQTSLASVLVFSYLWPENASSSRLNWKQMAMKAEQSMPT